MNRNFRLTGLPLLAGALLAVAVLLVFATPACAAEAASPSIVFAGWGDYFRGLARRDRVIQVCIGTAALALFILLKKFGSSKDEG